MKLKVYYPCHENNLCMYYVLHKTDNACIKVKSRGFSVNLVAVESSMYYIF
jgi:hypothetical protein